MIIAANLSLQLTNLEYEVTGIVSRGEDAILHVLENPPDILLLDINLKGSIDGIETAKGIQEHMDLPIIYLTANSDETTFAKAKDTKPLAFLTKPFNKINLQRTVALVNERLKPPVDWPETKKTNLHVLDDRIFVRHSGTMEKLLLADILYIEADRNYSTLVTTKGQNVLASPLKTMENKLPNSSFVRVHRSYMVNVSKLDVIAEGHLEIGRKVIPLSKSYKDRLMSRLQTI